MGYLKWDVKQLDEFVGLMFEPNPLLFPPDLWNPSAGILITMMKNIAEDNILPEVHVDLSMTPSVFRRCHDEWPESITLNAGPGTVRLFGCGPDFAEASTENKEQLAKQVRSVIEKGAELGQWFEVVWAENKDNMLTFEQVVEMLAEYGED